MIFELYMPICAIVFSLLLVIVYFSKKRIKLFENNMFSVMIVCILVDSILVTLEKSFVIEKSLNEISSFTNFLVCTMNRFDACSLIIFTNCLLIYIILVTTNITYDKPIFKKIIIGSIIFDTIMFILAFILKATLIEEQPIISITGPFLLPTYFSCGIYVLLSLFISIINFKKMTKKHIPLIITILTSLILMFIFSVAPYITIISITLTFVNFVMYFTIENPDKKLLEEIHTSKKLAESANEEKSMLIYNMMSDIKNIASDINKSSEIILSSNNIEENRFFAREIISSNNKLYSMANDIYNIDILDNINIKTVKTKYNIKLLLKEIVTKNKTKFNDKNISFRFNIDSNLPDSLYGDNINLKNVLNTILDNSYKCTEKGFVELSVSTIFKHDIARLIIKIEDSGIGIKAEDIDKCINKHPDKEDSLYGARKIINLLGGNLLISSEYNKGTIITIILDQKIDTSKEEDKYNNYLDDKKILIVDDNPSSIKLITKILSKCNINIDTESTGKIALDKIRKGSKYNLILLDEEMPYISGEVVIKKLKNIKNFSTPVVLLTKNKSIPYTEEYKESGFTDYILKPIDKDDLIEKINKYLK